ncbi:MAG: RdgB/HAM1 family non-canonical purine NTP pyrophosphatase [bacterium]
MKKKVVFATGNSHKIREASQIFRDFEIVSVYDFMEKFSPVEKADSFSGNALIKAEEVIQNGVEFPVLADDSGIVVPVLGGEPGVFSARYAGKDADDKKNRKKLLKNMKNISDRRAFFVCSAIMLYPDFTAVMVQGRCEGVIGFEEKGENGFGYDPVFIPKSYKKTAAEISYAEKHNISHRGKAFRKLEYKLKCLENLKD